MNKKGQILSIIVFAQFCCTSLWFAGNAVIENMITAFDLAESSIGTLTSAVQFGFIVGTLVFALLCIADRISPSKVFFYCALGGAITNSLIVWEGNTFLTLFIIKFIVGFCLSGIYPIGMKIASDYFEYGLGRSLSYLVGALVLGTGFPHLLKAMYSGDVHIWKQIILSTSAIAFIGGLLMIIIVPDGPHRKASSSIDPKAFTQVFKDSNFRSATFGYIGHMWELYAFWSFVPAILIGHNLIFPTSQINVSFWSFVIIASGSIGCIIGGNLSIRIGSKKVAFIALFTSGVCCAFSPFLIIQNYNILIPFLIFWGMVVIADSPLFSTLIAQSAPAQYKGTALTIATCIGFAITIISIQILTWVNLTFQPQFMFLILGIGPLFGLASLYKYKTF